MQYRLQVIPVRKLSKGNEARDRMENFGDLRESGGGGGGGGGGEGGRGGGGGGQARERKEREGERKR